MKAAFLLIILFSAKFTAPAQKLGIIDFPNSGKTEAQAHFETGVLLLHSFEYEDAAEEFVKAEAIDPEFAMAYWGEAMTYNHPIWMQQDYQKGNGALNKFANEPGKRVNQSQLPIEKGLMEAINILYGQGDKQSRDFAYMEYMKKLYEAYPENDEVASFYSLSILGTSHNGRDMPTYERAAAVGEVVFARNPDHPGALHYLIHSYDDPNKAYLGLDAADRYAKVAPAASHALHMPSHIYVAQGMWDQVVSSNIASAAAAEARMERKNLNLQARGYHALWWLEYGYLQQGRFKIAFDILESMKTDQMKEPTWRTTFHLVMMRGHYLIETNDWSHMAGEYEIETNKQSLRTSSTAHFVMGMRAIKLNNIDAAVNELNALGTSIEKSIGESERNLAVWSKQMEVNTPSPAQLSAMIMEKELEALIMLEKGNNETAEEWIKLATFAEENMTFMFGPPAVIKPSHELFGEMLLEWDRPQEAMVQFRKGLERAPNRTLSLMGLAKAANKANDEATTKETLKKLEEIWHSADQEIKVFEE